MGCVGRGWTCPTPAHPMDSAATGHGFPMPSLMPSLPLWVGTSFFFLLGCCWIPPNWGPFSSSTLWGMILFAGLISLSVSLRSAACLCILYTASKRILNSLEVGHFCRALKPFFLYTVRQRKPLLHCIVPALSHHCGFLWEIKQRFISPLHIFFYAATKPGFQTWAWLGFNGFSTQHGHWTPPVCFWSDFVAQGYKVLKW